MPLDEWTNEDFAEALRVKKDLEDSSSGLSIVRRAQLFTREKYIAKMKAARKEDVIFKYVGMIEGIDAAIAEADKIVKNFDAEISSRHEVKEEEGYGSGN